MQKDILETLLNIQIEKIFIIFGLICFLVGLLGKYKDLFKLNLIERIIAVLAGIFFILIGLMLAINTNPIKTDSEKNTNNESTSKCVIIIDDPNPPTNVRAKPNGRILGTLPNQKEIMVKNNSGDWLVIDYKSQDGYIFRDLTKEKCSDTAE